MTPRYRVGDVVEYMVDGTARRARVTARHRDIKDGLPGFDGELLELPRGWTSPEVWGYDDKIVRVEPAG